MMRAFNTIGNEVVKMQRILKGTRVMRASHNAMMIMKRASSINGKGKMQNQKKT